MKFTLALAIILSVSAPLAPAQGLYIDPADDEKYFGDPDELFSWTQEQQVAGYRNIEKIGPARLIPASTTPMTLPRAERDLGHLEIAGDFEEEPFSLSLDEYVRTRNVAGLLVIDDGVIVYERYGLGNSEGSRWVSFSVSKSVVSMLIGAAIRDGYIASVHEPVNLYLPRLNGSPYSTTAIRDLLQMASGVAWNEDYSDPASDVSQVNWETLDLYEYLSTKARTAAPGEIFNYNTAETNLAGNLLRAAVGNNLSAYLHHKIWQPFGMEADAWWPLTEEGGGEFGGCCLAATLRDYGRIGLFALADGTLPDGTRVLPEGWMAESTTPSKGADYYGYLWWLREGGAYAAAGIYGQGIYIDPDQETVIAVQAAWNVASDQREWRIQAAMFESITNALSPPPQKKSAAEAAE